MTGNRQHKGRPLFALFFWGSIYVMIAITLGLLLLGFWQSWNLTPTSREDSQISVDEVVSHEPPPEIESSTLRRYFQQANRQAFQASSAQLDRLLSELYEPVYAGIPVYADFHYSIRGSTLN